MKGISPLIASVLLIAFTISIAMIVMGWFSAFTRTTSSNISTSAQQAISCNSAGIEIEHIYVTGNSSNIVVKNTGFVDLVITGTIINSTGGVCTGPSATLTQGNVTSLTLTGCYPSSMGGSACTYFERAIVSTSCGGIEDVLTSKTQVTCS